MLDLGDIPPDGKIESTANYTVVGGSVLLITDIAKKYKVNPEKWYIFCNKHKPKDEEINLDFKKLMKIIKKLREMSKT